MPNSQEKPTPPPTQAPQPEPVDPELQAAFDREQVLLVQAAQQAQVSHLMNRLAEVVRENYELKKAAADKP